ncbi:hypothetical protein GCM10007933_01960 [Zoogloea oryzae]|uniref:Uncharacterized protein n=1 Tax=Zoogloea oryzae TaxID=310767 RepID=A0ABQ6F7C1_9RHOO|nr:hypothetical protein [Zoogloea oryzae]GLT20745.1 hypothetical protein GCM10007933_01960 [Zoogloea oryzae]
MQIQSPSNLATTYGIRLQSPITRQAVPANGTAPASTADSVSISGAARQALAAEAAASSKAGDADGAVEARLAEIRARGAVNRSQEDQAFLFANDPRLAAIAAQQKSPDQLTADELDYMQKATGLVNTMANLSPAEKALYDKAVASCNTQAAAGIGQIALVRMMGHSAGGAGGSSYDPLSTPITAANIENYFSHSIVDPSGASRTRFQALIEYLQTTPAA